LAIRYQLVGSIVAVCGWFALFAVDALAPAAPATPAPQPAPLYLALGDSLAAGMQPDAQGRDHPTHHGYVAVVTRSLARSHAGLHSRTLSCGGATSVTLLHGGEGCRPRNEPGQLEHAEDILAASPNTVLVTIDIGDNDIEACIDGDTGRVNSGCVARGDANVRRNLPQIARRLRAAAPPAARVVGLVDYDQFLSLWLDGAKGRAAARRSLPIILRLNRLASSIYRAAGIEVADASARFATADLGHHHTLPRHGSVPLAVYRICTLTWACSPEPIGHDDHARPAGYYQLGQAILDVLRPPG
jgi:lysophospholipase L1-like esterase